MHYRPVLRHRKRTDDQPGPGGGVKSERESKRERRRSRREWLKDEGGGGDSWQPEPMRAK